MNSNVDCSACTDLKKNAPEFVQNGVTKTVCSSLQNDTGLNPTLTTLHTDCEDLDTATDCMIGMMEKEVDSYDLCDWKDFMKKFINNLTQILKAIICAICGIWTNIHNLWNKVNELIDKVNCIYNAIKNLVNILDATTSGTSFVRYFRDNSGQTGDQYYWNASSGASHTLDIYMDANVDNPGSRAADRDYVVMISNCTDFLHVTKLDVDLTYYSSADTASIDTLRLRRAQHPDWNGDYLPNFSWTTSGAVLIKKGAHVKVNAHVNSSDGGGQFRLHQFVLTWIPVNIDASIDIDDILKC